MPKDGYSSKVLKKQQKCNSKWFEHFTKASKWIKKKWALNFFYMADIWNNFGK